MRKSSILVVFALLISGSLLGNNIEGYEKVFTQARSLKSETQFSNLIKELENVLSKNNPVKDTETLKVILSESYFEYSEIVSDRKKKEELLRKALELSEDVIKSNPQNGRAYYVASMCYARLIDFVNVFIKLDYLNRFDRYIDNAIRFSNDELYKGLSYMAKAVRYMSAPWPFSDTKVALENFKEAEKYIANYSGLYLYLGELYLKLGDKKTAESELRKVLNLPPHPYFLAQHENNVKLAKQILANLK